MAPRPWSEAPRTARARARWLLFDVDDTVTTDGRCTADVVAALERARDAGLRLGAVTGRSAAWAEALIRLLGLDLAVAETGALAFVRRTYGVEVLHSIVDAAVRADNSARRAAITQAILAAVPMSRTALDNEGRLYDVAFDLVEDGPALSEDKSAEIQRRLSEAGLSVARSSVHINAWFGSHDKSSMTDVALAALEGQGLTALSSSIVYVGDSSNDGPLFASVELSVGVANVAAYLPVLASRSQLPRYITTAPRGRGFVEVVDGICAAR